MNIKALEFIGRRLRPTELALLIKFLLGIKRVKYSLPDGRIYYIDPISDFGLKLQKNNNYEMEMTQTISALLRNGDTFIDLGSNEGYFSILASKLCGTKGKVFSIEPQQRLWEVIKTNCAINNCTNIQLLPFAIGSKNDHLVMNLYPTLNTGASSLSSNFNFKISFEKIRRKIYGQQSVKILRLDNLIDVLPKNIKLIKIDIEGFEFEAIKGSEMLLKDKLFANILVEIHPEALKSMNQNEIQLSEFLVGFGYNKRIISHNLNLYSI